MNCNILVAILGFNWILKIYMLLFNFRLELYVYMRAKGMVDSNRSGYVIFNDCMYKFGSIKIFRIDALEKRQFIILYVKII